MGKTARIDDGTGCPIAGCMQFIDQHPFVIRLEGPDLRAELPGFRLKAIVQLGQGHAAVDFRLTLAEQVQIGTVQNQNPCHLVSLKPSTISATRASGTSIPNSTWPGRTGSTNRRRPALRFLSRLMASRIRSRFNPEQPMGRPKRSRTCRTRS